MTHAHGGHWLQREDIGDVSIVRIKVSRLGDDDDTRGLFDTIKTIVDVMGRTRIVLNLASVEMMLSLGLGKIIMLNRLVSIKGGRLALCHLQPAVAEVFQITHVEDVVLITPSEEEAVKAVS